MNIYLEIMKALVALVKEGGAIGLWGLAIYLVMELAKLSLITILGYKAIKAMLNCINNYVTIRLLCNKDKIVLMSKEVSTNLEKSITDFQKETSSAMLDFLANAEKLLKKSEEQQSKK